METFWKIYEKLERLIGERPEGRMILGGILLAVLGLAVSPFDNQGLISRLLVGLGSLLLISGVTWWIMQDGDKFLEHSISGS